MRDIRERSLSWIELDAAALAANVGVFRARLPARTLLQAVVKSNAYGHGLAPSARLMAEAGVDSFGVYSTDEAEALAGKGLDRPILVLGYVGRADAERLVAAGAEATVYNLETIEALSAAAQSVGRGVRCHIKVETGAGRQGIGIDELPTYLEAIERAPGLVPAGVSTHFANIEDTTDHSYARMQLARFHEAADLARSRVPEILRHCACSAAILTMPETAFDMARVGIGLYGLWPSKETLLSCLLQGKEAAQLRPVLSWKARIAQVKWMPAGSSIGYGCTHRTSRRTRLGVVPVGYADGYDRRLSGSAYLLVRGQRAPVLGRICMNVLMVDLTDMEECAVEEEVVLIGRQGTEEVSATQMATLCHTISYEIVARIASHLPRVVVGEDGAPLCGFEVS